VLRDGLRGGILTTSQRRLAPDIFDTNRSTNGGAVPASVRTGGGRSITPVDFGDVRGTKRTLTIPDHSLVRRRVDCRLLSFLDLIGKGSRAGTVPSRVVRSPYPASSVGLAPVYDATHGRSGVWYIPPENCLAGDPPSIVTTFDVNGFRLINLVRSGSGLLGNTF